MRKIALATIGIAFSLLAFGAYFLFPKSIPVSATGTGCDQASLLSKVAGIQISTNATDNIFFISPEGQMPTMELKVVFVGDSIVDFDQACLAQLLTSKVSWHVLAEYWDGGKADTHKILTSKLGAQRSGKSTNDYVELSKSGGNSKWVVTPADWGATFGGGNVGTVTADFVLGSKSFSGKASIQILGKNPSVLDSKRQLGNVEYQILGYLESRFIQFDTDGSPLLNCGNSDCSESDGGFGMMQITDCVGAAGTLRTMPGKTGTFHGYPSTYQIWDWKENIAGGKSCFQVKTNLFCTQYAVGSDEWAKCGYTYYNGSSSYGDLGLTILKEIREGKFRAGWF